MVMKQYDSYKPSGVEWIGEIPSHWEYGRIKYLLSRSSAGVWGDDALENEDDIICYRVADFDYNHGILNQDNITLRNIQRKQLVGRLVSKGDLLVEKSGGGNTTPVGRVVRVNFSDKATCSNFIHSLSVNIKNNSSFLYYYFHQLYSNRINLLFFNQTTGIQNLQIDCYLSQGLYLPPLEEQERIAEYLDRRCAEIDGIINKEEQAIALLDELKQTIISEAVTYGLDPAVPLKPSGVDWIGQTPNHWEVRRLKYVVSCNDEVLSEMTPPSSVINYVEISDVTYINGIKGSTEYEFKDAPSRARRITRVNDVIISTVRTYLKAITRVNEPDVIVSTGFAVLRAQSIDDLYLSYVVKSSGFIDDVVANSFGVTYPSITASKLISLSVPLPPLEEQARIAEYLDRRCAEIDEAKERKQRQIELLREMKQTMISDAVTGRVKVF